MFTLSNKTTSHQIFSNKSIVSDTHDQNPIKILKPLFNQYNTNIKIKFYLQERSTWGQSRRRFGDFLLLLFVDFSRQTKHYNQIFFEIFGFQSWIGFWTHRVRWPQRIYGAQHKKPKLYLMVVMVPTPLPIWPITQESKNVPTVFCFWAINFSKLDFSGKTTPWSRFDIKTPQSCFGSSLLSTHLPCLQQAANQDLQNPFPASWIVMQNYTSSVSLCIRLHLRRFLYGELKIGFNFAISFNF